jgi:hypothetical protein
MAILAMTEQGRDAPATAGETPALRLRALGFHFYVAHPTAATNKIARDKGQMTTGNVLFINTSYNLLNATGIRGTQI